MSALGDKAKELETTLDTVDGLRVHTDPAAVIDPPAAVIFPPQLEWEAYCEDGSPTSARFLVIIAVAANDRAATELWDLVPTVTAAIHTVEDAAVTTATPRVWTSGTQDFPAYDIIVEVAL